MSTEAMLVKVRLAVRDARGIRDAATILVDRLNKIEDDLMEQQDRERAAAEGAGK
jgi:hypothetical protein